MSIAVGIAGWSYPDWKGYVYPAGVGDKLGYVARYVDMIEINSSFYRPPDAGTCASWLRRTEAFPGFFFTAKLHHDVTHSGQVDPGLVEAFHHGLRPLVAEGKLQCLLAQFPWRFTDGDLSRLLLARICESFGTIAAITFELRHDSWQEPGALAYIRELGAGVANLDFPMGKHSFSLQNCLVGGSAYLRLHGRNAQAWFDRTAGRDATYNYLYSEGEVAEIASRAVTLARASRTLTVVANNHYEGKELVAAIQLKSLLTGMQVPAPSLLMRRFPQLGAYAQADDGAATGLL